MLSLNCDGTLASAGNAGNSAASPEGRAAKKEQDKSVEWQRTPAGQKWCAQDKAQKPEWSWDTDPRLAGCRSGG